MSLASLSSFVFRSLVGLAVVAVATAASTAGDLPTRFFDSGAREMLSQLKSGEGWAVVSARAKVQLVPGGDAAECVKYRVVTNYKSEQTSNDQLVLQVEYSAETPWISLEFDVPKNSGTSLAAAKKANDAVALVDSIITQIEGPLTKEENAEVRQFGLQLVGVLRGQRAALVDLIQKDIQAIK